MGCYGGVVRTCVSDMCDSIASCCLSALLGYGLLRCLYNQCFRGRAMSCMVERFCLTRSATGNLGNKATVQLILIATTDKTFVAITDSISLDTMLGVLQHSRKKKQTTKHATFVHESKCHHTTQKHFPSFFFFGRGAFRM